MYNFTIGCDPELFISNLDGTAVSAHTFIKGSKEKPHYVEGGAVQVDGTALEFNTNPASSYLEFSDNIEKVLTYLHDHVEGTPLSDYYITYDPTAHFDEEYFNGLPDHVKLLGCMPDFNAYTGEENVPPATTKPMRTAGGHIHVGWGGYHDPNDSVHFDLCREVVKQLDSVLFNASKLWDADETRRSLYGNMGAFRPKEYGVEYRPLSCVWVKEEKTIKFVYEETMRALDLFFNKGVKLYA